MEIDWVDISDSTRVVAIAYVAEQRLICVRFTDGVEWAYEDCAEEEYTTFTTTSKGQFIKAVLDEKLHRRLVY